MRMPLNYFVRSFTLRFMKRNIESGKKLFEPSGDDVGGSSSRMLARHDACIS